MKLVKWLQKNGSNPGKLSRLSGVPKSTIVDILTKGAVPGVDKALLIEAATNGEVTCRDLARRTRPDGRARSKRVAA